MKKATTEPEVRKKGRPGPKPLDPALVLHARSVGIRDSHYEAACSDARRLGISFSAWMDTARAVFQGMTVSERRRRVRLLGKLPSK